MMRKKVFLVALIILLAGGIAYYYKQSVLRPHWVYLYSSGKEKRVLTIFYPKSFSGDDRLYIIPGKYSEASIPDENYAWVHLNSEATLKINWDPSDGRLLKIQFPLCEQEYGSHLDTMRYVIYRNCGPKDLYLDRGDSFYFPKYQTFGYNEWVINGKNDSVGK